MSEHTPTPWEVHTHHHVTGEFWCSIGTKGFGPITEIIGEQGNKTEHWQPVAGMKYLVTPVEEQKANAEIIVRAVNAHDALVAACEKAVERIERDLDPEDTIGIRRMLRNAIALANTPAEVKP